MEKSQNIVVKYIVMFLVYETVSYLFVVMSAL